MNNNRTTTVFLVDDNVVYRNALKNHLEETIPAIHIRSFNNGEEMLPHINKNPDAIILDYMLQSSAPRARNGMSILKKVTFKKPYTPVIILSEQRNKTLISQLVEEGAYDYVTKFENGFDKITEHLRHISSQLNKQRKQNRSVLKATALGFGIVAFITFLFYVINNHF
jgi:DNA-binding NtrC family response regulator